MTPDSQANIIGVVIPTYNEIANIETLIQKLLKVLPEARILVVDDNSPDRTWEVVEKIAKQDQRVHLLKRAAKTGMGSAYMDGFREILRHPVGKIVQLDADFSHPIESLPGMVALADKHDVVIGSRYKSGISVVNWALSRVLLSYGINTFVRFLSRVPAQDLTSGFKCYRREALEQLDFTKVKAKGFFFQVETVTILYRMGFTLAEHPIIFTNRRAGFSKLDLSVAVDAMWGALRLPFHAPVRKKSQKK